MTKPIASLSLDLDNKWCYLRTHGAPGWDDYPSFFDVAVPRILRTCVAHDLRLTCFVIGRDAEANENGDALAALASAGHDFGNHSQNHQPWLHTLPRDELELEIASAEDSIEAATGQRPVGFRAPAYSLSEEALEILAERGYHYDATTLPTYLGPLARWYFRHTASPEAAQEAERRELFGSLCEGLRSIRPYVWNTAAGPLVEMPVTTFPVVKLPIHVTYLVYLWQYSPKLARMYFSLAMAACRVMRVSPSLLLHPLDFLGAEDEPEMRFFPGMMLPREKKMIFLNEVLGEFASRFDVITLGEHAQRVRMQIGVPAPTGGSPATEFPSEAVDERLASDLIR